jgi:N-methylhydantoinase A/oxoprolinase/acetone carboxylase beta subunit
MLKAGFPREANSVVEIGGVRTLFRMPDLLSIALGGGTLIGADPLCIGPESTGYQLTRRGLVFGGSETTATDIAVASGLIELGDPGKLKGLPSEFVASALARMREMAAVAIDRMKTDAGDVPVIAVGGGAFLVPDEIAGVSEVIRVEHGEVANAVGAAIAQISGECDQVFQGMSRETVIAEARRIAEERAVEAGADPATLDVVEIEDLPLAYLPGNSLRARVRVVGAIA